MEGPTVTPFKSMSGKLEGVPHHPALYGRYIVIDLDENNRIAVEGFMERHPDAERPHLGFGVCRHGFGLQDFGPGVMEEAMANTLAKALNDSTPIGEIETYEQTDVRRQKALASLEREDEDQ